MRKLTEKTNGSPADRGMQVRLTALIAALVMLFALAASCRGQEVGGVLVNVGTPEPDPLALPTEAPTAEPTPELSAEPTPYPDATPELTVEPTDEPTELPVLTPTPVPTMDPSSVTGTLMFVGDLLCLSTQQRGAMGLASPGLEYDFRPPFEYVRNILVRADCAVGNLDTALSKSAPYSLQLYQFSDGMTNFNAPDLFLMGVKSAGIDALAMANNHCLDAGVLGVSETLDAVDAYGFAHTGLFRSQSEKRHVMLNVNGIRVALLSYSEFFNNREGIVADRPYVISKYSEEAVKRDVAAARADGAELVAAYNQWSYGGTTYPVERNRQRAQQMADAGVDIICGAHTGSIQPVSWLNAADGRRVLCMYSLGNFISSMSGEHAQDTFIAEIVIKRENGMVSIASENYHPVRVFQWLDNKPYIGVPTRGYSMPSVQYELEQAHTRIMSVLMSAR